MEVLAADSIFGHLPLEQQRWIITLYINYINALVTYMNMILSLHLLKMISFVRVAYNLPGVVSFIYSSPMMFSGMVRTAHPPAHAVSSTTLHGL